ncbi:MAG: iron ABC transporter substrate-binding protein [Chloroflexi bacterium]|nr:iron ABC transporter substrate-binding protein [Chloroflexota bacterium]MBP8058014.1 iron ABC transporter substrate-binding protein [Chloroflexota bacterium]
MRKYLSLWLVLFLCLLAAACQSNTNTNRNNNAAASPEAQPDPEADPEAETITEGGDASAGELVVYSGRADTLVQPIIDQFAAATGIRVEVRYGSTAEIAATLLEEGENSPADLFYAQDPGGLGAVEAAGLLSPLPEEILSQVPARFADVNGEWIGISGRARVIVYNTDTLTEAALPASIEGFTDPQWRGKIGWAPSNGSFQAMVTAMRNIWGEERTRTWLAGIQANEPVVFENNTAIVAAVGTGEIEIGFVNHYYLFRFLAEQGETFPVRNYFMANEGPESLIMVSGAGILKTAENRANAERFMAFLLSLPGQQYFTAQTFEYPVVEGVTVSPLLTPLAELDAAAADIALNDLSDLEGTAALLSELGILP